MAKKTSRRRRRERVDSLVRKKNKRMKNRLNSLGRVESGIYLQLNNYRERTVNNVNEKRNK